MARTGLSFSGQLRAAVDATTLRHREVFVGVCTEVERSVRDGSELTGAPGQPVDTGNLRDSWQPDFVSPTRFELSTNVVYAPEIEEGTRDGRALTLRSEVGGFHSVALTVAGFPAIVEAEAARLRANAGVSGGGV